MKKWLMGIIGLLIIFLALTLGALQLGVVPRPLITALLGLRYPDPNSEQIAPSSTLATFAAGTFLEGIAVARDGSLYIAGAQVDQGYIWHYVNGKVTEVAQRPGFLGPLALDQAEVLYAIFGNGLNSSDPATRRWQLVTIAEGETNPIRTVVDFPVGAMPNGISFDTQGNLYVADSAMGCIWRIDSGATTPEVWLTSPLLKPQSMPGIPGVNGIRLHQGAFYVTNSSSGEMIRIPIQADGRAGRPTVVATGIPGDDFAFDAVGNSYVTTHPYNVLVKVSPDGQKVTVGNANNGMIGATNAAFGRTDTDQKTLYVITDGGAFLNLVPYPFNRLFPPDTGLPSILALRLE